MFFSLDVIPARKGDCLMLHYGSADDPRLIMIDGGPDGVYQPHLRPRLEQIREARNLSSDKPLRVDLLMVSHVDDDHIQGILELTSELLDAVKDQQTQLVRVLTFWHNSFDNIIGSVPDELTKAFSSKFGAASTGGDTSIDFTIDVDDADLDEVTINSSLKVLASISQGAQLRHDAEGLNRSDPQRQDFTLNRQFEGKLIMASEAGKPIDMGNGLTFTVAGPLPPELKKLYNKHQAWLRELEAAGKSPEEVLAAYVDKSVPNLSSLVVLASAATPPSSAAPGSAEAADKTILLTGDARGDKILEGLEFVGLLKKETAMKVNVLKVPHHGSSNNLDNDFFQRILADHYVFSGDGEHGNPERESLEMLLAARGDEDYQVHFTYPIDDIDVEREKDWNKERAKEQKKKDEKDPNKVVRPPWSAQEHGLRAFFDDNPAFAKKARFVEPDKPHLIDLLEKIEIEV